MSRLFWVAAIAAGGRLGTAASNAAAAALLRMKVIVTGLGALCIVSAKAHPGVPFSTGTPSTAATISSTSTPRASAAPRAPTTFKSPLSCSFTSTPSGPAPNTAWKRSRAAGAGERAFSVCSLYDGGAAAGGVLAGGVRGAGAGAGGVFGEGAGAGVLGEGAGAAAREDGCLLYTSPSPRDRG